MGKAELAEHDPGAAHRLRISLELYSYLQAATGAPVIVLHYRQIISCP